MKKCSVKYFNKDRTIYYDILNIISCMAVCFLHCNGGVHGFANTRLWKRSLAVEVLCYFAVPVFVMLSGATLLKYKERYTTKEYFRKRAEKILLPWIIWSLIIYIVHNKNINLMNFINKFIYGQIEDTYWFFSLIIYLYCLIPVFSILTEKEEYRNTIWAIVIFVFIIQSMLQPILLMLNIKFPTILNYMTGQNAFIIYILLGYLLSTTNLNKKTRLTIYLLAFMAVITRYLYTMFASINEGTLNKDSWGYTTFSGLFPAVAVFVFIKNVDWEKWLTRFKIKPQYISNLSKCSFGIYLIHVLVRSKTLSILKINPQSWFAGLIFPILLYLICLIIVYGIKKIPILKKIVP